MVASPRNFGKNAKVGHAEILKSCKRLWNSGYILLNLKNMDYIHQTYHGNDLLFGVNMTDFKINNVCSDFVVR